MSVPYSSRLSLILVDSPRIWDFVSLAYYSLLYGLVDLSAPALGIGIGIGIDISIGIGIDIDDVHNPTYFRNLQNRDQPSSRMLILVMRTILITGITVSGRSPALAPPLRLGVW